MIIGVAPKNFKRGRLIGNKYRWQDLVIAGVLMLISIIAVITYVLNQGRSFFVVILFLIPSGIAALLLIPFNIHHNLLMYLHLILINSQKTKKFIWEGVILHEESVSQSDKK